MPPSTRSHSPSLTAATGTVEQHVHGRGAVGVAEDVLAVAAGQPVGAVGGRSLQQRVVAGPAVELVVAVLPVELVRAVLAEQAVRARAADDAVVTGAAEQRRVASTGDQDVAVAPPSTSETSAVPSGPSTPDGVRLAVGAVTGLAVEGDRHRIGPLRVGDGVAVGVGAAAEHVVAVGCRALQEAVAPVVAVLAVVAAASVERVVTVAARQVVGRVVADQDVVAGAAEDVLDVAQGVTVGAPALGQVDADVLTGPRSW